MPLSVFCGVHKKVLCSLTYKKSENISSETGNVVRSNWSNDPEKKNQSRCLYMTMIKEDHVRMIKHPRKKKQEQTDRLY